MQGKEKYKEAKRAGANLSSTARTLKRSLSGAGRGQVSRAQTMIVKGGGRDRVQPKGSARNKPAAVSRTREVRKGIASRQRGKMKRSRGEEELRENKQGKGARTGPNRDDAEFSTGPFLHGRCEPFHLCKGSSGKSSMRGKKARKGEGTGGADAALKVIVTHASQKEG